MSKRAEELAWKAWDFNSGTGEWPEYRDAITALIDAELRKERERCAERAVYALVPSGDSRIGAMITVSDLRSAILFEEE